MKILKHILLIFVLSILTLEVLNSQTLFFEYYEKGLKFMKTNEWDLAIDQFSKALLKEPVDNERKWTYGVQFIEYYPNREIGIAYYNSGNNGQAITYLEKSQSQVVSKRTIDYLNKIGPSKKNIVSNSSIPAVLPQEKSKEIVVDGNLPPMLAISNIKFEDANKNNRIDGNEECSISFTISNTGKGSARNLIAKIQNSSTIIGLKYSASNSIGTVASGASKTINIPIAGTLDLLTATANIKVSFEEQLGFPPDPFEINIETKEFAKPDLRVVDNSILTDDGTIRLGKPIQLKTLIQNIGQGIAENVNVSFKYPESNVFPNGEKEFAIGNMEPGAKKEVVFEFIANKLYTEKSIPVTVNLSEKFFRFSEPKQVLAVIDNKSAGTTINIASNADDKTVNIQIASLSSEIDKNIPKNEISYPDRYALIFGNEDYTSRQTGLSTENNVMYAVNDARTFKDYVTNTLGVDEKNVFLLTNATAGEMSQKIELVSQILTRIGKDGELIFYYAGHGYPDEITKLAYLIPVDVNASSLNNAIRLNDIYKRLSQTNAKRITIFLDACFTGGGRDLGLIASRGVKIIPKEESLSGNIVVFSASSGDQSALPFKEKQHGIFTYFLLKKLQDSKGDITYSELDIYLQKTVSIESLRTNSKPQDPKTTASQDVFNTWANWKLK